MPTRQHINFSLENFSKEERQWQQPAQNSKLPQKMNGLARQPSSCCHESHQNASKNCSVSRRHDKRFKQKIFSWLYLINAKTTTNNFVCFLRGQSPNIIINSLYAVREKRGELSLVLLINTSILAGTAERRGRKMPLSSALTTISNLRSPFS